MQRAHSPNYAFSTVIGTHVGNYIVRKELGRGGMGAVYMAEHPSLGLKVAVKVLLPNVKENREQLARFQHEARAVAALGHDHIVRVLDFGELSDGSPYMVMEWLDGRPLSRVLQEEGPLTHPRAAHIAAGIARALDAAHRHNIVHRDLKPDNVFVVQRDNDTNFAKVLDFGVAKVGGALAGDFQTSVGTILGTPYYMAPEQLLSGPIDARTDVYALGVMLYELTTGNRPFSGENMQQLLSAILNDTPRSPRQLVPALPEFAAQAILRAIEKDPEKRFPSILSFAEAFAGMSFQTGPVLLNSSLPPPMSPPSMHNSGAFSQTTPTTSLHGPIPVPPTAMPITPSAKHSPKLVLAIGAGILLIFLVVAGVGVLGGNDDESSAPSNNGTHGIVLPQTSPTIPVVSAAAAELPVVRAIRSGRARFVRISRELCGNSELVPALFTQYLGNNAFSVLGVDFSVLGSGTLLNNNTFTFLGTYQGTQYRCDGVLTQQGFTERCYIPGVQGSCFAEFHYVAE